MRELEIKGRGLKDSCEFHKRLFPQPPYPSAEGFKTLLAEIPDPAVDLKKVSPELFLERTLLDELRGRTLFRERRVKTEEVRGAIANAVKSMNSLQAPVGVVFSMGLLF